MSFTTVKLRANVHFFITKKVVENDQDHASYCSIYLQE